MISEPSQVSENSLPLQLLLQELPGLDTDISAPHPMEPLPALVFAPSASSGKLVINNGYLIDWIPAIDNHYGAESACHQFCQNNVFICFCSFLSVSVCAYQYQPALSVSAQRPSSARTCSAHLLTELVAVYNPFASVSPVLQNYCCFRQQTAVDWPLSAKGGWYP